MASSPGLERSDYPGSRVKQYLPNRNAVAPIYSSVILAATPLALYPILDARPRVAPASQPWAGGHSPVGIGKPLGRSSEFPAGCYELSLLEEAHRAQQSGLHQRRVFGQLADVRPRQARFRWSRLIADDAV